MTTGHPQWVRAESFLPHNVGLFQMVSTKILSEPDLSRNFKIFSIPCYGNLTAIENASINHCNPIAIWEYSNLKGKRNKIYIKLSIRGTSYRYRKQTTSRVPLIVKARRKLPLVWNHLQDKDKIWSNISQSLVTPLEKTQLFLKSQMAQRTVCQMSIKPHLHFKSHSPPA